MGSYSVECFALNFDTREYADNFVKSFNDNCKDKLYNETFELSNDIQKMEIKNIFNIFSIYMSNVPLFSCNGEAILYTLPPTTACEYRIPGCVITVTFLF